MSTGTIANRLMGQSSGAVTPLAGGANGAMTVGVAAESQRAMAEIQAALVIAQSRPRDEMRCLDRISNACQRIGLAERAEYSYSKGGTEINGPTIDLLTVIANCWGNMQFGFRELSQQNGESTIEAFAWDLESNTKRSVVFTVPHKIKSGQNLKSISDPREIYELVANNAQRRVRACLEAIVPTDVVDSAVDQCRETLKASEPVTPDKIKALVEAFAGEFKVSKEQIEARIQRRVDTITPAQMLSLRRIWKSLKDGMSNPGDWFKPIETQTTEQTAKPTDKAPEPPKSKRIQ